jgi:septum formation protein
VIYLASQSPARVLILRKAGIPFTVAGSTCDEEKVLLQQPQVLAVERARCKARAATVSPRPKQDHVVLAADTVTALGTTILGKPHTDADSERMLQMLQGTIHTVFTGHCCVRFDAAGKVLAEAVGVALAKVTMRSLTPAEIHQYVAGGEGRHCSGAYALQGTGDRFILDVQGSMETVIGLHLETVARLYRECTDSALPGYVKA